MKAAGYPSGKYTGSETVQVVVGQSGNGPAIAQIVANAATSIGLKPKVSAVDQSTMYSKYCGVPKQEIDSCPTAGWIRDFADPLGVLYLTFYGPAIVPTNNTNWSQQNDPAVNAAMLKAALVVDPAAHIQAWANVDKMLVDQAVAVPEDFDNQPQHREQERRRRQHALGPGNLGRLLHLVEVVPWVVVAPPRRAAGPMAHRRPPKPTDTPWPPTSSAASSGGSCSSSW